VCSCHQSAPFIFVFGSNGTRHRAHNRKLASDGHVLQEVEDKFKFAVIVSAVAFVVFFCE
jgi:hypothetical protein